MNWMSNSEDMFTVLSVENEDHIYKMKIDKTRSRHGQEKTMTDAQIVNAFEKAILAAINLSREDMEQRRVSVPEGMENMKLIRQEYKAFREEFEIDGNCITEIVEGSISIRIHSPGIDAMDSLFRRFLVSVLEKNLEKLLITQPFLQKFGLEMAKLKIFLDSPTYAEIRSCFVQPPGGIPIMHTFPQELSLPCPPLIPCLEYLSLEPLQIHKREMGYGRGNQSIQEVHQLLKLTAEAGREIKRLTKVVSLLQVESSRKQARIDRLQHMVYESKLYELETTVDPSPLFHSLLLAYDDLYLGSERSTNLSPRRRAASLSNVERYGTEHCDKDTDPSKFLQYSHILHHKESSQDGQSSGYSSPVVSSPGVLGPPTHLARETKLKDWGGCVALLRRPTTPTPHYSDGPQLRRPTTPTAHNSDAPLLRHPTTPTTHYSDNPQLRQPTTPTPHPTTPTTHYSDTPQLRQPTTPTPHYSDTAQLRHLTNSTPHYTKTRNVRYLRRVGVCYMCSAS